MRETRCGGGETSCHSLIAKGVESSRIDQVGVTWISRRVRKKRFQPTTANWVTVGRNESMRCKVNSGAARHGASRNRFEGWFEEG